MKAESSNIENLIEKFFEGKTSSREEKELLLYFSDENIPDHLKQHKEFFLYYGNDFMTEVEEIKLPLMRNTLKRRRVKMMIIAASAIAAVLAIAIIVKSDESRFDPYEGSYMLVNGEKIYDVELIKEQETEIRKMAAIREREYREIYSQSQSKQNEFENIMMGKNK